MKRLLSVFILLVTAAPLFAHDEGGDGAEIPSYQELVREGFGPRQGQGYLQVETTRWLPNQMAPKPTQAYYANGYAIYYGYTAVPTIDPRQSYAFGYSLDFFRHLMPASNTGVNLSHYAVEVNSQTSPYGPGDAVAQGRNTGGNAISTVQSVAVKPAPVAAATTPLNGTATLPAIGEKPAH